MAPAALQQYVLEMFDLASNLLQSVTMMEDGNNVIREIQGTIAPKFNRLKIPERIEWRDLPKNPTKEALVQTQDFYDKSDSEK